MDMIIFTIALIALLIGTFTDMKTREIPDWVTYSLMFVALGLRLFYSLLYKDISYIINGAAGFVVFLALAYLLFYTGQWGGGDAKILMGLGALIGLEFKINTFLISFFINTLVAGSVFALFWAIALALLKRKKFANEFKSLMRHKKIKKLKTAVAILLVILVALSIILQPVNLKLSLISLALVTFLMFYTWLFVKAVENSCMFKLITTSKLTEGDWIAKNIIIKGKTIAGPKDLGITKQQITKLKKLNIQKVLIKEGIPFTPAFLAGFFITYYLGNLFFLLL